MPVPDDFLLALEALGEACIAYRERTGGDAILVGGAAAALLTAGAFMSADFDVIAVKDVEFEAILAQKGFVREDRVGHLLIGFYHPSHPRYGFQLVSGRLFEGLADRQKLLRFRVGARSEVVVPSIEDMIADRLGQHAVGGPGDMSRLQQAKALFALAPELELSYLSRRIREEGGDPGLLGLPGEDS